MFNESLFRRTVYEEIIRCHTGLPAVHELSEGYTLCSSLAIGVLIHYDGRFASEFEGCRYQFGRCLRHYPACRGGRAGEKEIIGLQIQQSFRYRNISAETMYLIFGEVVVYQALQKRGGMKTLRRGIQEYSVACSNRSHQGRKCQLKGIIPWRDYKYSSQCLRQYVRGGRYKTERCRHSLLACPLPQMFQCEVYLRKYNTCFCQITLRRAFMQVIE